MDCLSRLYANECEICGCETNSGAVRLFAQLDRDEPSPTQLSFCSFYLGDRGTAAVCLALQTVLTLEKLELRCCGAEQHAAKAVVVLAESHPRLTSIDLTQNSFFASSGRQFAELLRKNRSIVHLALDHSNFPKRISCEIATELGKNLAARYPLCKGLTPHLNLEDLSIKSDSENELVAEDALVASLDHLDEVEVITALRRDELRFDFLAVYHAFGAFAVQLIADMGPPAAIALLKQLLPLARLSPLEKLARDVGVLGDALEMPTTHSSSEQHLERIGLAAVLGGSRDGTRGFIDDAETSLLRMQVADALSQWGLFAKTNKDAHLDAACSLLSHVFSRLTTALPPSGSSSEALDVFKKIDARADVLRDAVLVKSYQKERRLLLLKDMCRYFLMDAPTMPLVVDERYHNCGPPLRLGIGDALREVLAAMRQPFAAQRRGLLRDLLACTPTEFIEFLVAVKSYRCRALRVRNDALDGGHSASYAEALFKLYDSPIPEANVAADFIGVCANMRAAQDAGSLCQDFRGWLRYKTLLMY